MSGQRFDGVVTGDRGISRHTYIESLPDREANLREAWVTAREFTTVRVQGGAAEVASVLGCECVSRQQARADEAPLESIYLLTRSSADGGGAGRGPWQVSLAIVAGERQVSFERLELEGLPPGAPLVVVDFRQGWLESNYEHLPELLRGRRYLVRTHDRVSTRGAGRTIPEGYWATLRAELEAPGVWFSPYQDMADGALRVAGNWETVSDTLSAYLQRDGGNGLWDGERWLQHIVIQISYDGALVVSPPEDGADPPGRETVLRFPCDQPGSLSKRAQGTVVGGGICIAASLAEALSGDLTHDRLVEQTRVGLARARRLVTLGYSDPPERQGLAEDPPQSWHLFPQPVHETPLHAELPVRLSPPEQSMDAALRILTADQRTYERMMVYRLGKLYTCEPAFAEQLIRLEDRIQSHVHADEEEVMSFAVLGTPGSGKSFAAKQLLEAVGGKLEPIEFNVSQFTSEELLVDALRQVQTLSLRGKVPFVIWDEFDCVHEGSEGGWLSRFLMPMADAQFRVGGDVARLGKCVFAFVGSVWSNAAEFDEWVQQPPAPGLKGRDFHSRLDRVLQVPSVEIARGEERPLGCPLLTRALIIRLALAGKGLASVDRNVAEFLLTADLRHGVRSLRKIIDASQLDRTERFSAYHLPPEEVLQVHAAPGTRPEPDSDTTPLRLEWTREEVRVGVTGHRFLAEIEKLRISVERALDEVETAFPDRGLAVISPLAEGADRLVAEAALKRGAELLVPLPLPKDDYMTDFESEESKQQFLELLDRAVEVIELPETDERDEAYAQVGEWVLDHSDALIAIWDGQAAQGRGGTADIAGRALDRGMPVLHIKAGNRKPGTTEPTSLGEEQGELVVHNL
ncbi:MAG: hypothetical protein U9R79_04750 [Armatimonadota bacterium]|nr:hypothetical protein [Armatimonadota bacterium]